MSSDVVVYRRRWPFTVIGILAWMLLVLSLPARGDAADRARYKGQRVLDVLAQVQAEGVRIIMSSALVPATLVVKREPRARTPRELASEILAPHGLALQEGPRHVWVVVVKAPPKSAGTPARPGRRGAAGAPPAPAPPTGDDTSAAGSQAVPRIEERVDVVERLGEFAGQPTVRSLEPLAVRETAGGLENPFQVMPLLPGVAATDDDEGKLAVRGAGPQHNSWEMTGATYAPWSSAVGPNAWGQLINYAFYGDVLNVFNRENHTQQVRLEPGTLGEERMVYNSHPIVFAHGIRATF